MLKILFLCTGNSCRSQMAEGWVNAMHKGKARAFSAGVAPSRVDTRAVAVMKEAGIDISSQRAKHLDEFRNESFDYVITVCDRAREACPVYWGGAKQIHAGFDDPPFLARTAPTEEEALGHYRRVRDEIKSFVENLPGLANGAS